MVEAGELMIRIRTKRLNKTLLRKEFSKHPKEYYSAKIFEEKGFKRQKCNVCGMNFWSIKETNNCGDSSHTPYGFFRDKPRKIRYVDFWKKFSEFFKDNGHEIIKRYPVVSRWRPDLYFTIAGIQDFQRLENGVMSFEYSANPLLVPQPCLRFGDIENVGITGGHFTAFMMANQTAFNYPKEGYWRDRTMKLNFELLTKLLEISEEDVIYHEDVWAMPDFSVFGPSLEAFPKGLEIVNNVFTQFELVGNRIRELASKVVDVGWSFEKNLWFYTGYSSAYEATFSETLEKLRKEVDIDFDNSLYKKFATYSGELNRDEVKNVDEVEKRILRITGISKKSYEKEVMPAQAVYAVIDHTRALLFAVTDGSLPSNVGGGYNLRLILRRSLDFLEKYKLNFDMQTAAGFIAKELKEIYPELSSGLETFDKVVDLEKHRYGRAKESAKRVVEVLLDKSSEISKEQAKMLYESNGVTPELITSIAASKGIAVKLPENVYTEIIQKDMVKKEKEQKKPNFRIPKDIKETKKLYYDFTARADAKVLFSKGKYFVLDKTPFYPESGGQVQDTGTVNDTKVVDVQKIGEVIVHIADENTKFKKGEKVNAVVDEERRKAIIAHHTATHLISAAARKILGPHAWQEGAKKEQHKARIDIVHYDKLDGKQVRDIEGQVNSWLLNGIKVNVQEMSRGEAEGKYGVTIYQGHGVPAKRMRIVTIKTLDNKLIDAEACGGLHAAGRENYVGMVKIISTARIHDGIDRIEFVAGPAALKWFETLHDEINKISGLLSVDPLLTEKKVEEQQQELRLMHKIIEKNNEKLATSIAEAMPDEEFIEREVDVERKMMIKIADLLIKRNNDGVVLLKNKEGYFICMAGSASKKSAIETLKLRLKGKNFSGGGSEKFAEAKLEG